MKSNLYNVLMDTEKQNKLESKTGEKIVLCTSVTKKTDCRWTQCSFAHDISEQHIDEERMELYKLILDKKYRNIVLSENTVNKLHKICETCSRCLMGACQGGLNCRNGAYRFSFKVCRNDINHNCLNKVSQIEIDRKLIELVMPDVELEEKYYGCINGHHLSTRGIKINMTYMKKICQTQLTDIKWESDSESELMSGLSPTHLDP